MRKPYGRGSVAGRMAYDEGLAARVRDASRVAWTEKRMFGGLCFMHRGHMVCGIVGDRLMLRMGDDAEAALREPHTAPMDFTGKPLRGMLYVEAEGVADDDQLRGWVERALQWNAVQPAK